MQFCEGECAYDIGLPVEACPYDSNSDEGSSWLNGWWFASAIGYCREAA